MQFIQLELCFYTMTINRCNKIESQMKFLTRMSLMYIQQKTTVAVFSLYCFCYIVCYTYWSLILKLNTRAFNFLSIGNSFASELIELINIEWMGCWFWSGCGLLSRCNVTMPMENRLWPDPRTTTDGPATDGPATEQKCVMNGWENNLWMILIVWMRMNDCKFLIKKF